MTPMWGVAHDHSDQKRSDTRPEAWSSGSPLLLPFRSPLTLPLVLPLRLHTAVVDAKSKMLRPHPFSYKRYRRLGAFSVLKKPALAIQPMAPW